MFSALFRRISNTTNGASAGVDVDVGVGVRAGQENNAERNTPSFSEIMDYSNKCIDTYCKIIRLNEKIADDMMKHTRLLIDSLPSPPQIRTCPSNHELALYTALGGNCDVCNRIVFLGEQVMDCRQCNWYMCGRCARRNGITIPQTTLRPTAPPPPPQTELFTFDVPLNGTQSFDDFVSQLAQTLNQVVTTSQEDVVIAPTEVQIDDACDVMLAREAQLSEQYVCPIDLSPISGDECVMKIKHCGHVFRESNLRELFKRDVKCPLCRYDIRDTLFDNL
jgi:hypothetical protein